MIPGEILPADGNITLNEGLEASTLTVANTGDRPVARVGNGQGTGFQPLIQCDVAVCRQNFTRDHDVSPLRMGWCTVTSLVPSGKVASA